MNIAPEGRKILLGLIVASCISGVLGCLFFSIFEYIFVVTVILLLFCINFFRDPKRTMPKGKNILLSPADGKIVRIEQIDDPDTGKASILISIFLNVFNVHVNRMPIDGKFLKVTHKPGKFLAAFDHKASDENEQTEILIETDYGIMKVKQIAGLIARRIHCYANENGHMQMGDRLGFIMFGSRTDIIFSPSIMPKIELGQKVIGGVTIIGQANEE